MKALILILFISLSSPAYSAMEEKYFHLYGALGELYRPASYRIGYKSWEIGKLNQQSVGLAKLFYKGNVYGAFGFSIFRGIGLYGGMGVEYPFWKVFSFRAEVNGTNSISNYSHGEALVGLTFFL